MPFPPMGNSDHVVFSVSLTFCQTQKGIPHFNCIPYGYSCFNWDGLCDHLKDVPREYIFKLRASTAASEFFVQVRIDPYIPHRKYQVKCHSSSWLSAACADAITHRNIFYRLYQQNKSSESKVKFRQPGNHCKRVVEAAKLAYANKTKISLSDTLISLPRNLALKTFVLFLIVFTTKVNLLYLCYSTVWKCCLLCLIKQNSFLKNVLFG